MKFKGRIKQEDKYWSVEIPSLCIYTQGKSKEDAYFMAADAVSELIDQRDHLTITVIASRGNTFTLSGSDDQIMLSFFLSRLCIQKNLSRQEIKEILGDKQEPTLTKFERIITAINPKYELIF